MKNIFAIILILSTTAALAQDSKDLDLMSATTDSAKVNTFRKYYPNACYLYKSAEDYYSNNPIPTMEWHIWDSGNKIEVVEGGKTEMRNVSELETHNDGHLWYSDQNGLLVRNFRNTLYRVVVDGPICYYVELFHGEVDKETDSTFKFSPSQASSTQFFEYYSMTIKGDLKDGFDKLLEKYLKEYKLLDQYNSEKVERTVDSNFWDVESDRINKKLKYLRIINSKLAVK